MILFRSKRVLNAIQSRLQRAMFSPGTLMIEQLVGKEVKRARVIPRESHEEENRDCGMYPQRIEMASS
jgi:hypothetical protein